ncbi:MAG: 6-carboxytetrahydropterin synthase QueD [Thermoanaerobaculia bacterium]|nr:6-carboxytetrahydropterin synthase QueD [Thermoanaerobaculia bacterium]
MESTRKIRVTKSFTFEMAHALEGYDGECKNLHGHSFRLEVTLRGAPLRQAGHPKNGMVMDFKDLKKLVQTQVLGVFDHALVLNESTPATLVEALRRHYEKVVLLPFQPTSENMLLLMVDKIRAGLPGNVELYRLVLHETATSSAEWCAEDNP